MDFKNPALPTAGDVEDPVANAITDAASGASTGHGLAFTITNGAVTAVQQIDGSHSFNLHIPSNATFTLGDGVVTETLTGAHSTTMVGYVAEAGDASLFQLASTTETFASPSVTTADGGTRGTSFTVSGGTVTAEQVSVSGSGHSHSFTTPIPADAEFTVGAGTVVETLVHGDTIEALSYVQPAGQTLYALASDQEVFVSPGAATTRLDVETGARDEFTFGAGGSVTAAERVHADGSTSSITLGGHVSFTQLAGGLVEEIDTFGSHSSYEVFATGADGGGIYTAIAHGEGSAVDVAGLNAQLAQLPTFFTDLI